MFAAQLAIAIVSVLLIPCCMIYCKNLAYASLRQADNGDTTSTRTSDSDRKHDDIVRKLVIKVSIAQYCVFLD
jgi:hypothetical protein